MASAPKKKAPKKKAPKTLETEWDVQGQLSLSEELFCRYMVLHESTRGNQTRSYDLAYDKKLDEQSKDDAVYELRDDGEQGKLLEASTFSKVEQLCATEGHKLCRKPKIGKRMNELLNELLANDFVDAQLAKVIAQDYDLAPKVRAISEYNKLKKRITEQIEHTFADDDRSDEEIEARLVELEAFFKKKPIKK